MDIKPISQVLAVAALLLLVMPVWTDAAEPSPSSGPGLAEARNLLKRGRFEEVLAIVRH